jgi:formylglycine-generating enzyme required for sulfatase activity
LGLGERLPILAPLSGYANALEKSDIRLDDFIADYPRPGVSLREDGLPDLRWVKIPGTVAVRKSSLFSGFKEFRLGDGIKRLEIADFELTVYPVTVAQFRPFVEQGGYQEDRYWSKTGLKWRREAPGFWDDLTWTLANHPVMGVS